MGSSAFKAEGLPAEVVQRLDKAIDAQMTIVVGEAHGACRLYQDYLRSKNYRNVIVGHAVKLRYNAGNWKDVQYGKDLEERESRMIEDCDSAIVIWMDGSGVIAEDLELLKRTGRPTFVYECSSDGSQPKAGELDPNRTYDPFYDMNAHYRRRKANKA